MQDFISIKADINGSIPPVTVKQFEENMASLKEQGMKGQIIDLRSNPGGSVTSVCAIAEQILPEGLIFYMEDAPRYFHQAVYAEGRAVYPQRFGDSGNAGLVHAGRDDL